MEDTNRPQLAVNFHRCKDEGTVQVTILRPGDPEYILMSEEEFDKIVVDYTKFMQPIWEERSRLKQEAEQAERAAAYEAGQRVVEISGVKARVQYRVKADFTPDYGRITGMWVDGFTSDTAPFVVNFDAWTHGRPYFLRGPVWSRESRIGGQQIAMRREVFGAKGGALRFGTAEAAFKRAIELGLHKVEEKAE